MKTKKFNFDWRSLLLGMVVCMVLVVFVGSYAQSSQSARSAQSDAQARVLQKAVNLNEVMVKCELIDQRILVLEGKINMVQERCDQVHAMVQRMSRGDK